VLGEAAAINNGDGTAERRHVLHYDLDFEVLPPA
jgi:hypothetical protein